MPQIIKTVSLNPDQADFINSHPSLKLSSICQKAINDLMEDSTGYEIQINQMKKSNSMLQEALTNATDQLDQLNCNLEDGKWICPKKSSIGTKKSVTKDK